MAGLHTAITPASAILQYIVDMHPQANIGANADAVNVFEMNETLPFLASNFHPAFWPLFFPQRYTTETSEDALQKVMQAQKG